MPRPHRLLCGLAAALLLTGCSNGSQGRTDAASTAASPEPTVSSEPLLRGLDVCSLATPTQVRRAVGQVGEPTSRQLTRIHGYDGLVDQCGFGVSFDSYTFVVSVGLAPATREDLAGLPGEPVDGVGDAARVADQSRFTTVSFLKGDTLVQVLATKGSDEASRVGEVTSVARTISRAVPADPPETDDQTEGVCAKVDAKAVDDVLGAPSAVSRTLLYQDRSAMCSFATGTDNPRTVAVNIYSNQYAGPFFAEQKKSEPFTKVPGIAAGDAFTIPGTAYVVAKDGQAVSVVGDFPPEVARNKPVPVTPQLTALLTNAASLMQQ